MKVSTNKLTNTINNFCNYIEKLPYSALEFSKKKQWGPREVLCHIVFWHEQYVSIITFLINNEKPLLLEGKFSDLNAYAVQLNKYETKESLLKRLQVAQKELHHLCINPGASKIKIQFKEGGKKRSLVEVITRIESHIRSHQRQLQRAGFRP